MRKTLSAVLTACLLCSSFGTLASLEDDMGVLKGAYRTVMKTDDLVEFKKALTDMRNAAEDAKKQTPEKLKGQSVEDAEMNAYRAEMDKLIGQIDTSMKLAEAGNLPGAKAEAKKFDDTRKDGHKKFR
ncbi:cytochrome b562 [Erwinia tracheiphila]|uniref:Cytochrome B562 n=1 Tax=Erwinia tracheiphila TaxID=65700 RepID=A0A0M2KG87_9GAMM|nr:cytochrome b562 [Erwinia tracheiphila]AXF77379.1 cytochrome B562 [Erwinia tracheiphila]EOS95147.1 cytochrome b562 [Erwinia tracheiphila PSU-1]KKF36253.1 cytochrome B562 [Erwinia tracheiphila]UIA83931.1 cytochrome b562 [Erwinia tracheiphila]UIA87577.1 cytochrome b562 [Erwinia tracheiphila]